MANVREKAQCVAWFIETKSDIQVQRNSRTTFNKDPPSRPSIRRWHKKFMETGSVNVVMCYVQQEERILRLTEHSLKTFSVTVSYASTTASVTCFSTCFIACLSFNIPFETPCRFSANSLSPSLFQRFPRPPIVRYL
jgi:hypothetical protein